MSHTDSDLEEGEIPDDLPSSPMSKPKELPRRYILGENKGIHQKHKKDCKYAIRRHAKKLVQLNTTPTKRKITHKLHHKSPSYSHNKSSSKSNKHDNINAPKSFFPKIVNTYPLETKRKRSPFEDHSVFRPNSKTVRSKSERYPLETKAAPPISDCKYSKMLKNYKSIQLNNLNNSVSNPNQSSHNFVQNSDLPNLESTNLKVVKNVCNGNLLNISPEDQAKEETDNIEELRRIALATCAKRNMIIKQQILTDTNMSASEPTKVSPNHISNYENRIADNYEVVDMDVDEDNQSSFENVDNQNSFENVDNENSGTDDIFIIDTKPSLAFQTEQSSTSKVKTVQYCSDDDFETDLLRAELIESLCRKRSGDKIDKSEKTEGNLNNLQVSLSKPDKHFQEKSEFSCNKTEIQNGRAAQIIPKHIEENKERIASVERNKANVTFVERNKANVTFVERNKAKITFVERNKAKIAPVERNKAKIAPVERNKAKIAPVERNKAKIAPVEVNKVKAAPEVNKVKIVPIERSETKIVPVEMNKTKIAPIEVNNPEVNKSPKRLIISLNGESSSEESDQDLDPVNALPGNPVASIEALISDIRQKSDSKESNEDGVKVVPKAVSCLSKAQQEEYNALMKILEKKKIPEEDSEVKNKIVHSPIADLKLLEKKLTVVKETLKMKKELMNGISKEVTSKKCMYLKSKLTAQHLKEKYVAAEKERRIKLDAWSKSCKSFDAVKKSVSEWENKVTELQSLCSKVGSSIQRQNGLSSIKTVNE